MGFPDIEAIRGVGGFATSHLWELSLISPSEALMSFFMFPNCNILCKTSEVPKISNPALSYTLYGHEFRQPSFSKYTPSIKIIFVEPENYSITKLIRTWRKLSQDRDSGALGTKEEVTATVNLARLDKQHNIIYTYKLYDCALVDSDLGEMKETSSILEPSITLTYNMFEEV